MNDWAQSLIRAGKQYRALGWSVIPLRGKVPQLHGWTDYRASDADLHAWFNEDGHDGIGIVCGDASGNLAVIDVEGTLRNDGARMNRVKDAAKAAGVGELLHTASIHSCASTPSGGIHLLFEIGDADVPGNTKLAFKSEGDGHLLLAETRGQGGQIAAPPGKGRSWGRSALELGATPCTIDQWQALCGAFTTLDEADRHAAPRPPRTQVDGFDQPRGGDGYAQVLADALLSAVMSWTDFLDPGWTGTGHDSAGRSLWLRPAYGGVKTTALSSAHGMEGDGTPVLVVHSSSVPHLPAGQGQRLTPYRVLAACRFNGDEREVDRALELAAAGVADPRLPQLPLSVLTELQRLRDARTADAVAAVEATVPDSPEASAHAEPSSTRELVATRADTIAMARATWLWEGRLPVGALSLLAGREGLGKSTLAAWLVARITRGELDGELHGQPRGVVIVASEDDWPVTVVPRLVAAGADLSKVSRVEVAQADVRTELTLPVDIPALGALCLREGVALVLLDPLMSRINAALDTHKDLDVRRALDPITRMAEGSGAAVLGLMHVNKMTTTDPLTSVMGSRAFTAVARSVTVVVADPDDEAGTRRIVGTPKNNLGRTDLPLLPYTITGVDLELDDGTTTNVGALAWSTPMGGTLGELLERSADEPGGSGRSECTAWLDAWLVAQNGREATRTAVLKAAKAEGWPHATTVDRAARRLGVVRTVRTGGVAITWTHPSAAVHTENTGGV